MSLLKRLVHGSGPESRPARKSAGTPADGGGSSHAAFTESMLHDFFVLAHQGVRDNYDYARFSYDGTDRSGSINAAGHANYLNFFFNHAADLFAACELLDDPQSRELFRSLVLYRMLGHLHVQIKEGAGWSAESELYGKAKAYDRGESKLHVDSMFGPLRHHTGVPTPGGPATLDCWNGNIVYTALKKQYFLARGDLVVEARADDVVIDAGACFGIPPCISPRLRGRTGAFMPSTPCLRTRRSAASTSRRTSSRIESLLCRSPFPTGRQEPHCSQPSTRKATCLPSPGFPCVAGRTGFP